VWGRLCLGELTGKAEEAAQRPSRHGQVPLGAATATARAARPRPALARPPARGVGPQARVLWGQAVACATGPRRRARAEPPAALEHDRRAAAAAARRRARQREQPQRLARARAARLGGVDPKLDLRCRRDKRRACRRCREAPLLAQPPTAAAGALAAAAPLPHAHAARRAAGSREHRRAAAERRDARGAGRGGGRGGERVAPRAERERGRGLGKAVNRVLHPPPAGRRRAGAAGARAAGGGEDPQPPLLARRRKQQRRVRARARRGARGRQACDRPRAGHDTRRGLQAAARGIKKGEAALCVGGDDLGGPGWRGGGGWGGRRVMAGGRLCHSNPGHGRQPLAPCTAGLCFIPSPPPP
jgi:hypothetical protein